MPNDRDDGTLNIVSPQKSLENESYDSFVWGGTAFVVLVDSDTSERSDDEGRWVRTS